MTSLLQIRGVSKSFPGLRGVDLDLQAGEGLAVLGKNGEGKSTLIGAIIIAAIQNGRNPPEEIARLRYKPKKKTNLTVPADSELVMDGIGGNCLELSFEMDAKDAKQCGVKVCCSPPGGEEQSRSLRCRRQEAQGGPHQVQRDRRTEERRSRHVRVESW